MVPISDSPIFTFSVAMMVGTAEGKTTLLNCCHFDAPNDETIRLVPALNIGDVEVDEFIQLFTASLRTVEDALVLEEVTA